MATKIANGLKSNTNASKIDGEAMGTSNNSHSNNGTSMRIYVPVTVNVQGHVTTGSRHATFYNSIVLQR